MTLPFLYTVLLFFVLPLLAWSSGKRLRPGMFIPRLPLYAEVAVIQLTLISFSLVVARREKLSMFGSDPITVRELLLAFLLLATALTALVVSSRRGSFRDNLVLEMVAPRTRLERLLWIPVSLLAGLGEEIAYRGVLPQILTTLGLPLVVIVALCSVAFGLAHAVQGTTAVLVTALFGVGFHLLVLNSQNLYGAIAVHFLYDLIAGYLIARWLGPEGELV